MPCPSQSSPFRVAVSEDVIFDWRISSRVRHSGWKFCQTAVKSACFFFFFSIVLFFHESYHNIRVRASVRISSSIPSPIHFSPMGNRNIGKYEYRVIWSINQTVHCAYKFSHSSVLQMIRRIFHIKAANCS